MLEGVQPRSCLHKVRAPLSRALEHSSPGSAKAICSLLVHVLCVTEAYMRELCVIMKLVLAEPAAPDTDSGGP